MKIAIVIPARYGSTRFPGKPLAKIGGKTMLERVVSVARAAASRHDKIDVMVTTDDDRIAAHCKEINVPCVMTTQDCATGSDRVLQAIDNAKKNYDFLISLQGDVPFTPPEVLDALLTAIEDNPVYEVITPAYHMRWADLDSLRDKKKTTPFSGTTCIRGKDGYALWFSKQIIPAIRDEQKMRTSGMLSPVWQHIGVYGYRTDILRRFVSLEQGHYERLEGLEQLRFLENGISVYVAEVKAKPGSIHTGIDTPEDLKRAEAWLKEHGDPAR